MSARPARSPHSHQTPQANATLFRRFTANSGNPEPHPQAPGTRPVPGGGQNVPMDLGRAAWIVTVLVCLVTGIILLLENYYGYAGVTLAVALSAFINLF